MCSKEVRASIHLMSPGKNGLVARSSSRKGQRLRVYVRAGVLTVLLEVGLARLDQLDGGKLVSGSH